MRDVLLTAIVIVAVPAVGDADDVARRTFERQLFSPTVISASGLDAGRFSSIGRRERSDAISAKTALAGFFRACHTSGADPTKHVSALLAEKYRDGDVLKKALFDAETEVVLFFVSDFSIVSEASVEVKYVLVLFSEGSYVVREDHAMLKKEAGEWKILSVGGLH